METVARSTGYMLRIFTPGSASDPFETLTSPTGFGPITVGDVIEEVNASLKPGKGLRVTAVVHRLGQLPSGSAHHWTGLHTEEVDLAAWHAEEGRS